MKTRKLILSLISLLALTSCNNGNNSSVPSEKPSTTDKETTNKDTTPSNPSTFYDDLSDIKDGKYLFDYFSYVGNHGNYTLTYSIEGTDCYDLFTEDYYYMSIINNGGILLPYYNTDEISKDILYRYDLNGDKVDVLLPEQGVDEDNYFVSDVNEISYFSLLTDENNTRFNIKEDDFKLDKDNVYYTDNKVFNTVLAMSVGYASVALNGLVAYTTFDFLSTGDISFSIYLTDATTNSESLLVTAKFKDIDRSRMDVLEKFRLAYRTGASLSDNAISVFNNKSMNVISQVTEHNGNETPVRYMDTSYQYDETSISLVNKDLVHNREYNYFYEKAKNGYASVVGLNGLNEVETDVAQVRWDELSWLTNFADAKAFRKISDNTYRYYGFDSEALFYSLTYYDFKMAVKTIDVVVENDKIKEINTTLYSSVSDTDSSYVYYTIKTTFSNDVNIVRPAPYQPKTESEIKENNKIKEAFDKLKAGNSYEALFEDYGYVTDQKVKMTVANDIIYFESLTSVTDEQTNNLGYVLKDGKVIPFAVKVNEQGVKIPYVTKKCVEGDTLDNHIGFKLSSEIFTRRDSVIIPKQNIINLRDYMFGFVSKQYMVEDTLAMAMNNNNEIVNIKYSYIAPVSDSQTTSGYENVSISKYGTAKLGINLTEKIRNLKPLEE